MAVEIFMQKVLIGEGVRYDLVGKNLPENFLGMAVDLKFTGLVAEDYQKLEWGKAFAGFGADNLPIKMVKNDLQNGRLIVGITLRADNLKMLHDGVIGSFFFEGKNLQASQFAGFDHQLISVYQNGRVDLQDVNWLNGNDKKLPSDVARVAVPVSSGSVQVPTSIDNVSTKNVLVQNQVAAKPPESIISRLSSNYPNLPDLEESYQSDLTTSTLATIQEPDSKPQSAQLDDSFWWYCGVTLLGVLILLILVWFYLTRKSSKAYAGREGGGIGVEGGFA